MKNSRSQDPKSTALGQELISDARWLVTNLVTSDAWGQGSEVELLDGSAWQHFARRLATLGERIHQVESADPAVDRPEGYRYLLMLLRNALDVAIEDIDPDYPRFNWLTRRNKMGWDCPDALYGNALVLDNASYRITGRRQSAHFLGLQVMGGVRTLRNLHADEIDIDADGRFEIIASPEPSDGNWLPIDPGAETIWVRQFFYDWENETPASLWIERVDDSGDRPPPATLEPGFMARRLDALAANVEANVDMWLRVALAQRKAMRNRFPQEEFGGSAMGAQAHQRAGTGSFCLEEDEALLIEVRPPRAKYWSFDLASIWLESLDYANHQSSLNGHQAVLDSDGLFRAVVSHRDPRIPNWLDTVGRLEGSMIYRWNLSDSFPIPNTRLIKWTHLDDHLPADTPRIDPQQRANIIDRRRRGVHRRFTRPL